MSLLTKGGGITKLSELLIDADKDWQAFGISNLKELALAMAKGDFAVRGDTVLQRLQPSTLGYVLTSAGLLHIPSWQPPPGPLLYYFPAPIDLSHTKAIVAVDHSISKPDTIAQRLNTDHSEDDEDNPAELISQTTAGGALHPFIADIAGGVNVIAAADKFIPKNAPHLSALSILCDGFVEEAAFDVGTHTEADSLTIMTDAARAHWVADALIGKTIYNTTDGSSGVITDNDEHTATVAALAGGGDNTWQAGDAYIIRTNNTVNARSAGANDINLCPQSDTVLDKIYIGSLYPFWQAQIQVGTNGSDNWANEPYYWNGAWAACVDPVDGSNSFLQGTGLKFISHTPQVDWALSTIMGMNLYWMMIRTDVWTHRVTKPLGTQVWVAIA